MGNFSNTTNLITLDITPETLTEKLVELVKIDNDYKGLEGKVVDDILKTAKTLEKQIEGIINYNGLVKNDISPFLIGNENYCSGYEIKYLKIDENRTIVAIAYTT